MVNKRNNFSLETDEKKIRALFILAASFRNAGLVVSISLQRTQKFPAESEKTGVGMR